MDNDPRYADINNGRGYPALTRADAYKAALKILRHFSDPKNAAMREGMGGQPVEAYRGQLMAIFRRWLGNTRQLGSSKGLGRTCWAATRPTCGHRKGWGRLIHDVSHMIHEYRHPKERPHGHLHSAIEREVQTFVDVTQMPAEFTARARDAAKRPSTDERRHVRLGALHMRLKRWESKQRRAENAAKKLRRQIRALEKAAAGRLPEVYGTELVGRV